MWTDITRAKHARMDSHTTATVAPNTTHMVRLCRLAFVSPEIQLAILTGREPPHLSVKALLESNLSNCWETQQTWLRLE